MTIEDRRAQIDDHGRQPRELPRVAFQGDHGAFSEEAVLASFGASARVVPCASHRALAPFAERGIDLLRIESRPILGEPWRYLFYLDLEGTPADPQVRGALAELAAQALAVRILGCFDAAAAGRARRAGGAASPSVSPTHRPGTQRPGRKAHDVA